MADHLYFSIVLALARHALYAAADLPEDNVQRTTVRHQVGRLHVKLQCEGTVDGEARARMIGRLLEWFDAGAIPSDEMAQLSEATT